MMAFLQLLVFAGALALIAFVLAETVVPALPRMAALLRGAPGPTPVPRDRLALSPRAAVRARPPVAARSALREAA